MLRDQDPYPADRTPGPTHAPAARLLILSVAGLGDFVMGTPALRAIRRRFPDALVWLLALPEVKPLADRCPYLDAVRTFDLRKSRSALWWALRSGRTELWRLLRELRAMRFDSALNLYSSGTWLGGLRMAAFLRAVRAGRTVGRSSGGLGFAYDLTSRLEGHEVEAQLEVARLIGAEPCGDSPELWVTDADRAECADLLRRLGLGPGDPLACIHASSVRPEACWPLDRFAAVGERLGRAGARSVVIGTAADRARCAALADAIPGGVSTAGATTLPTLAALLERSRLLVTNDSGPMHMGAALGVPLVVPFGPASPARFGPRGTGPCQVFTGSGGGPSWWMDVSVEQVSRAALELFRSAASEGGLAP
jgi:ADP-heptose:LPS heptosyltransferase